MTRKDYIDELQTKTNTSGMANTMQKYINYLEAKIEEQEIIIKDKTAFMEAMAQPKTCEGCIHYSNKTAFGKWCNCARNTSEDEYFDEKLHER